MAYIHNFGGAWTQRKLQAIYGYLTPFHKIFTKSESTQYWRSVYIDAFAGTGSIALDLAHNDDLFAQAGETEEQLVAGSAALALQLNPGFDSYLFIDKDPKHIRELEALAASYPSKVERVQVIKADANKVIQERCSIWDRRQERGLVLLDPYGMSVDWVTLEALASTKACDVMILFPLGQAVNRMLTRDKLPIDSWRQKLTKFFGSSEWEEILYKPDVQETLFDESPRLLKASVVEIQTYFTERLRSIFCTVTDKPLELVNSTGAKLFLLYVVSNNPSQPAKDLILKLGNSALK